MCDKLAFFGMGWVCRKGIRRLFIFGENEREWFEEVVFKVWYLKCLGIIGVLLGYFVG